ncbi:1-acyl-sn-glycerol-3-phosphate acyltransferase [Kribbella sp. NBC_01245]|uniref:lysophospholipid acyltransferase family protein n=1 Tax=Kribbella sp. NBC_01245 TaxID=2903578 RepID=UPI002E29F3D3|nr:1-acyl-sn-glycerol-3-phosphate acyltransferase [Kribbella sp. NBC_01245]
MADADIIPIGSGGRPGRGSGRRTTPSAAARSLAGPAAAKAKRKPEPDAEEPTTPSATPKSSARSSRAATGTGRAKSTNGKSSQNGAARGRRSAGPVDASDAAAGTTEPSASIGTPGEPGSGASGEPGSGPAHDVPADAAGGAYDVPGGAGGGAGIGVEQAEAFLGFEKLVREWLGPDGERKVAELLAFLRRRLTGQYEVDEFGYDEELTDEVFLTLLRPLAEKWFRVEVRGIENIPDTGGALIVANHSGTMPVDGLITQLIVRDHAHRPLRTLAADLVFQTPFVGEMARKGGATLAGNDDAERLLGRGDLVGVWPEGFKGIGKPFSERYRLQRFGRGGFVSAAMRTGVPIVPCSIVGAEEIYPLVGNISSLARLLGVPYIPVTPFFPLLGPLGLIPLPSKWLIEFGEPIRTDEFAEGAADDPMLVFNVTDQVRETIQQTLYALLMQRRSVFF